MTNETLYHSGFDQDGILSFHFDSIEDSSAWLSDIIRLKEMEAEVSPELLPSQQMDVVCAWLLEYRRFLRTWEAVYLPPDIARSKRSMVAWVLEEP